MNDDNAQYTVTFFDGTTTSIEFREPNQWFFEEGYLIFENEAERLLVLLNGVQSVVSEDVLF